MTYIQFLEREVEDLKGMIDYMTNAAHIMQENKKEVLEALELYENRLRDATDRLARQKKY